MARRVYFSFHFERDIFRVNQVRNSWLMHRDRESAGFWDAAERETLLRAGERAITRWIDGQLYGTSVTVVLIGAETAIRKYVHYEIEESIRQRKGFVGIRIHGLKSVDGRSDTRGANPFDQYGGGSSVPIYDWIADAGRENIGDWVEDAARAAGR